MSQIILGPGLRPTEDAFIKRDRRIVHYRYNRNCVICEKCFMSARPAATTCSALCRQKRKRIAAAAAAGIAAGLAEAAAIASKPKKGRKADSPNKTDRTRRNGKSPRPVSPSLRRKSGKSAKRKVPAVASRPKKVRRPNIGKAESPAPAAK